MSKRVLWVSSHHPHSSQLKALQNMYGQDVIIDRESPLPENTKQLVAKYYKDAYDDLVVVASLPVVYAFYQSGVRALCSEAALEKNPSRVEFYGARGQGLRFVRFRRVRCVKIEYDE